MTVLVGASRVCTRKRRVITAPTPYEEESAMVVLGLVLLVGAGVFAASVISSNTGAVGGDLWGLHISNVTVGEVFVAGLAAGAVALLGLVMMLAGSRRSQRHARTTRGRGKPERRHNPYERPDDFDAARRRERRTNCGRHRCQ